LATACAVAKNSRGLLTVTSLRFFRSTVSGFCGASPCCQDLAHFHSTLLPASCGCRFQHCTWLTPDAASGKLDAPCSSLWPYDQSRFHCALPEPSSHSDRLPKHPTTLRYRSQRTEQPAPLSSRCCPALFRSKLSVGSRVRSNLAAAPYPARLRVSTGVLILIVTFATRLEDSGSSDSRTSHHRWPGIGLRSFSTWM
jgi:hypothetical protein